MENEDENWAIEGGRLIAKLRMRKVSKLRRGGGKETEEREGR